MLGLSNGIRENVSDAFIFARKLCDIGCLESSRSTLECTCRDVEQRKDFLKYVFNTKTNVLHPFLIELERGLPYQAPHIRPQHTIYHIRPQRTISGPAHIIGQL